MCSCLVLRLNPCTIDVWSGQHLCAIDRDIKRRKKRSFCSTTVFWPLMSLGQRLNISSWTSITGSNKFYSIPSSRHTTWPLSHFVLPRWVLVCHRCVKFVLVCNDPYETWINFPITNWVATLVIVRNEEPTICGKTTPCLLKWVMVDSVFIALTLFLQWRSIIYLFLSDITFS